MTLADYSMVAFALLNGGRILAYLPQIIRVYRDPYGATAVSVATWALFAAANVATVWYALSVANDRIVAIVFAINGVGCLAIVVMTLVKRLSCSPRAGAATSRVTPMNQLRRRGRQAALFEPAMGASVCSCAGRRGELCASGRPLFRQRSAKTARVVTRSGDATACTLR